MLSIVNIPENNDYSIEKYINRTQANYDDREVDVRNIVENVKKNGDDALYQLTEKFDNVKIDSIKVSQEEINDAFLAVDNDLVEIIKKAKERITNYHEKQKINSWFSTENGEFMGQLITPIEKVGVYVPGGKAFYPSSVLMNVIPAKVAGAKEIVMTTPPGLNGKIDPYVLVAAKLAGVDEIYKIGGAQAIAALAFGTQTVKKVYKIVGPGNVYVAIAKKMVFGTVSIDSIAGPSEILIVADDTANPKFVAADLLSQAEHDELASSILVTTSKELALQVKEQVEIQTNKLSRRKIVEESLVNNGMIFIVNNLEEAINLSNKIAPEHLELCVKEPFQLLTKVTNAGAVFLGNYSPEPLGDYMAGPNHVLPTCGTAKFFSPLNVNDFVKRSSVISFSKESLSNLKNDIVKFAEAEELTAHANAIKVRF